MGCRTPDCTNEPRSNGLCRPCVSRAYKARNKERIREWGLEYRQKNKEAIAEQQRAYHVANREKVVARVAEWRRENPHFRRAENHRYRALRRGLRCEHGECKRSAARARILDNPCAYCGAPAEHADHVTPLARGGLDCLENLAPACARCNLSKGSQTVDEFLERQTAA